MKPNIKEIVGDYIQNQIQLTVDMSNILLADIKDNIKILIDGGIKMNKTQLELVGVLCESLIFHTAHGRNLIQLLNYCLEKNEFNQDGVNGFSKFLDDNEKLYGDVVEQFTELSNIMKIKK